MDSRFCSVSIKPGAIAFARTPLFFSSSAMVRVNAGTVHLMAGDLARARAELDAALLIDPDVARAHNGLGVIAARENRMPDAIAHWKRAVAQAVTQVSSFGVDHDGELYIVELTGSIYKLAPKR